MTTPTATNFQGRTFQTVLFDGLVATETEYDYQFIDWHYHENPYFSLVIQGNCREITRRGTLDYAVNSLVFHNCDEPHASAKAGGISRHFQLELQHRWCNKYEINLAQLPPSEKLINPQYKLLFYNIYKEAKLADESSDCTVDTLLLQAIESLQSVSPKAYKTKPRWVNKIDEILREDTARPLSLLDLSQELNLHWAHLSREFAKHFRCNFGEYQRKIRVEKSLALLRNQNLSLTEIAAQAGFSDQSHFIRCFKQFHGITPKAFRKILQ